MFTTGTDEPGNSGHQSTNLCRPNSHALSAFKKVDDCLQARVAPKVRRLVMRKLSKRVQETNRKSDKTICAIMIQCIQSTRKVRKCDDNVQYVIVVHKFRKTGSDFCAIKILKMARLIARRFKYHL